MSSATTLRFEWVTDSEHFAALRDQWNLLGSSAIGTVFLTHAWLSAWLEELAPDAELHVLTAWDGDRLVAALPLFGAPDVSGGRRWAIMGTGTLTPNHLDLVAEPAFYQQALDGFTDLLLSEAGRWDVLELDKLPADTAVAESLNAAFQRAGYATACSESALCLVCDLPSTYDAFLAARSKSTRKKIKETGRRFAKHSIVCALALADTEPNALHALHVLERSHQARWNAQGYPGAFADPRVVRFHDKIVRATLAAGELRMYTLTCNDQMVAVSYNFRVGPTVESYLSSYDNSWADLSPGVLLRGYVIEESIEDGASCFDYLEGAEHYKKAWCTGERPDSRLCVFNHTLAGRLARLKNSADQTTVRLARRWVPQGLRENVLKVLARRNAARQSQQRVGS